MASSVSDTDATSFGIQASVPIHGVSMSLGPEYHSLIKDMDFYSTRNYYGEVERQFTVFTAQILDPASLPLAPAFKRAIDGLPDGASSDADVASWLAFFSSGEPIMSRLLSLGQDSPHVLRELLSEDRLILSQSDWIFNLKASFNVKCGLKTSWAGNRTEAVYEVQTYMKNTNFFGIGGDPALTDDYQRGSNR